MTRGRYYTENADKWRVLADIDYITYFVKAWIPFNAWYKNYYAELSTDNDIISEIKTNPNRFRDNMESLLRGTDIDSRTFQNHIAALHTQLGRYTIRNKSEKITFEKVVLERNSKHKEISTRNGLKYEINRDPSNHKKIESKIVNCKNGNVKLLFQQTNGFDLESLKNCPDYLSLNPGQKETLSCCYNELNPNKPVCLLTTEDEYLQIGQYHFINNIEILCKGIITILYLLRNSLFHGEIIPDKDTNRVYEHAYHILHQMVIDL
jgi:hypothetical protein